ncbi:DnaD domain protein [Mycoplasma struthionis]|uniref:Replicative helicase loading/DNA remodeling protein DnaB N-terminal winged helix domain-containing protein n=1 Tax=Mycoplasma struthionis TaxID=538220 RepID=A0A3G8LI62_9MOLU|nr:DnaD domain protein [Mycoplasma struthionis]AZG68572.1 hypothetical protein EGN60_01115 [Mycoplasma struthionis]TPI02402.1 hypothetical protein FJM01_00960 [Mycoplasma struthionis]
MKQFYVENTEHVKVNDLRSLRIFYSSIIGKNAVLVYQHLFDLNDIYDVNYSHLLSNTLKMLSINEQEFIEARFKLEALSLLKTYEDEQNNVYFVLQKPLNANEISNSHFLESLICKNIGSDKYGDLLKQTAEFSFNKKPLKNVSKRYFDVFSEKNEVENFEGQKDFEICDEKTWKQTLSSEKYIEYKLQSKITIKLQNLIDKLRLMKFDDFSINCFLHYSLSVNKTIVSKYVEKIAKDFAHKNLFNAELIDNELNGVLEVKNINKNLDYNKDDNKILPTYNYEESDLVGELDWEN